MAPAGTDPAARSPAGAGGPGRLLLRPAPGPRDQHHPPQPPPVDHLHLQRPLRLHERPAVLPAGRTRGGTQPSRGRGRGGRGDGRHRPFWTDGDGHGLPRAHQHCEQRGGLPPPGERGGGGGRRALRAAGDPRHHAGGADRGGARPGLVARGGGGTGAQSDPVSGDGRVLSGHQPGGGQAGPGESVAGAEQRGAVRGEAARGYAGEPVGRGERGVFGEVRGSDPGAAGDGGRAGDHRTPVDFWISSGAGAVSHYFDLVDRGQPAPGAHTAEYR
mmetsp:Transcript_25829/g.51437  ORF Transcript_25829/g.51437 Transcript_25829/m.51437 type:complete len:273 (-) Transcript_25829:135-953(-)